jgi:hypothetical protein
MIDDVISAELARALELLVIAGRGNHGCAEEFCDLNGCRAHA